MLTSELLTALHDERITFGEFVKQTHTDFMTLAASVVRRWRGTLPAAIELDDLCQEMLLAVHIGISDYTPGCSDIRKFIVFRACTAARDVLARQARYLLHDGRGVVVDMYEPEQEIAGLAHELLAMLPIGPQQYAVINSLARTGSMDDTVAELLDDANPHVRIMFDRDPDAAKYSVYRTARKLARRAQATA